MCFGLSNRIMCPAEKEEMAKTHAAALKQEQDQVATLRLQLDEINKSHKAQLERAASVKTQLDEEIQKLREAADIAEKKADLAQVAARQFQSRIDAWTAEFKKVQENMQGEFL